MRCEIYPVQQQKSIHWKWRHVTADGTVKESAEAYALYYECVIAARSCGFEPALKVA